MARSQAYSASCLDNASDYDEDYGTLSPAQAELKEFLCNNDLEDFWGTFKSQGLPDREDPPFFFLPLQQLVLSDQAVAFSLSLRVDHPLLR
mmetsp:Transcript_32120/g.48458  ORF Transcript_32120/g.48458 Transcript_32120/m.48458 type:complete len:91 (-) Transcript_32120:40-312(-)